VDTQTSQSVRSILPPGEFVEYNSKRFNVEKLRSTLITDDGQRILKYRYTLATIKTDHNPLHRETCRGVCLRLSVIGTCAMHVRFSVMILYFHENRRGFTCNEFKPRKSSGERDRRLDYSGAYYTRRKRTAEGFFFSLFKNNFRTEDPLEKRPNIAVQRPRGN